LGTPVSFVITDVSDRRLARRLGLNFAPKLPNITRGCPACAQSWCRLACSAAR
jgi:hypothetical protein